MLKTYYQLTKPGIIYGNAITAIAGFLLASKGNINFLLFAETILGISFVMASSCVLNNIFDRDIDKRMNRTKNRAIPTGVISIKNAIVYSLILGAIGFSVLFIFTNLLTTLIALTGFIFYLGIYTPLKRRSIYSTLVGSIAGAVPPVVGYCAVTNRFDLAALILFMILVLWQMPHFYAIAIVRRNDYLEANIPILTVKKNINIVKVHMLSYIILFIFASLSLTLVGYTGYLYLVSVAIAGLAWLALCVKGLNPKEDKLWARKMFRLSLLVLLTVCITMSFNVV